MQKIIHIQIPYYKIEDSIYIKNVIKNEIATEHFHYSILKRSIDARTKNIKYTLKILISDHPIINNKTIFQPSVKPIQKNATLVHIIGAGPAGLFAALQALEYGIKPIIFEQGKNVQERRRDLVQITRYGKVNPYSNYCFGEGGAGTYSDGKLYTRSNKRGDIEKTLKMLVYFGASEDILIDTHPHIGTNKLPKIIENIRHYILENGGEIHFYHQLINIKLNPSKNNIQSLVLKDLATQSIKEIDCKQVILATGHSARSVFEILHQNNILLEFKPFALGVRVEHPQELIDKIQYHCNSPQDLKNKKKYLPPANYSLIYTDASSSTYSFCMCPGGIIAPCATDSNEVVTNGWSPSKRNNPFANSGIVVAINQNILPQAINDPLAGLKFQQSIEQKAFEIGGKNLFAPAQRLTDFLKNKSSSSLPACSYKPGTTPTNLHDCIPNQIYNALKNAFIQFNKKMKGYISEDAVLVAPESRTSSPVRIPRCPQKLHHVQINNLYPCAEGAGYAGGIISAAIDGMNVIQSIYNQMSK